MLLLHYANWYKGVYEMSALDRPADDVIDDDQQLDAWWDQFTREQARTAAQMARQQSRPADGRQWMSTDTVAKKMAFRPEK